MALFGRKKKAEQTVVEAEPERLPDAPDGDGDAGRRSVAAHRDYLLSLVEPLPPFGMQLLDAVGLGLCEDLEAYSPVPAVDLAMIEGYAVHAGDVALAGPQRPVSLLLAGEIGVGEEATGEVGSEACVRLVAGAPMPRGTNAVVPLDHAEATDRDHVAITLAVQPGQYVRAVGSDIAEGETLLRKGDRLDARIVGMLAGAGIDRVMARPRPRVVVLSTGSELVEPGHRLKNPSDTHDANSYMLAAAARALGASVFRVGLYTRDPATIREAIGDQLIRADLLISTGGVSKGDYDLVKDVLPELGLTDFANVAMAPGQAQGFALIGAERTPMIMLPGNPVSAYVSFTAFVVPVLRKLMGNEPYAPEPQEAITKSLLRSRKGETAFVRARVENDGKRRLAEPFTSQTAHQLGDLAQANALIVVPPEKELIAAGDPVQVWMLEA